MTITTTDLRFKIATEAWEFDAIHQLNYATFVEEIPQHAKNAEGRLVDQFHEENTYVICLKDDKLIGMGAVRDRRPFSLDFKLADVDSYLPPVKSFCETRLLSVHKNYRHTTVARDLLLKVIELCLLRGYELSIISATTRQLKLYKSMGFVEFGHLVGTDAALYQPMYVLRETVVKRFPFLAPKINHSPKNSTILLQPGPVPIHPDVQNQFQLPAISHRSEEFRQVLSDLKKGLCQLSKGHHVQFLMGSGTLANEVVAGQLAQLPGRGIILANGEFGERLQDHGRRWQLNFIEMNQPWGTPLRAEDLRQLLAAQKDISWVWFTHCETSTGEINDLAGFSQVCREFAIKMAVDCISSLGTVSVDIHDAWMATAVSGKGLGSYPGISIIFYQELLREQTRTLPRYLDLNYCIEQDGVPFTLSSHQIRALLQGVLRALNLNKAQYVFELSEWLVAKLKSHGAEIVVEGERRNPTIITIALPEHVKSLQVGEELANAGYYTSYQSGYLARRNWLQLCFFGENYTQEQLFYLVDLFTYYLA